MSAVSVKEGRVYINYRDEQDEPEAGSGAATPLGKDSAVNITSNMGKEAEIGDNRTRQRSMSDGSGNGDGRRQTSVVIRHCPQRAGPREYE